MLGMGTRSVTGLIMLEDLLRGVCSLALTNLCADSVGVSTTCLTPRTMLGNLLSLMLLSVKISVIHKF